MYLWVEVPRARRSEACADRLLEHGIVAPGSYLRAAGRGLRPDRARADRSTSAGAPPRSSSAVSCDRRRARSRRLIDRARPRASCASPSASTATGVVNEAEAGDPRLLPAAADRADGGRPVRVPRQDPAQDATTTRAACASCRRRRALRLVPLATGVIMMPSYVNIGAWVGPRHDGRHLGDRRLVRADRRGRPSRPAASVSAACSSRRGRSPVIVEDGAFIGSRAIVTEGVRSGAGGARRRTCR